MSRGAVLYRLAPPPDIDCLVSPLPRLFADLQFTKLRKEFSIIRVLTSGYINTASCIDQSPNDERQGVVRRVLPRPQQMYPPEPFVAAKGPPDIHPFGV